jgi:hypothetical protein
MSAFVQAILLASVVGVLLAGPVLADGAAPQVKGPMTEIIANIKANEELYTNLEVVIKSVYQLNPETKADELPRCVEKAEFRSRCVLQGNLCYTEETYACTMVDGNPDSYRDVAGYDGELTRRLTRKVANIHQGRYEVARYYRPHTVLVLESGFVVFPLSLWLGGGAALRGHVNAGIWADVDFRCSFEKEEVVDGLRCLKLRCEAWTSGQQGKWSLNTVSDLWLAPDRNYIPVQRKGYIARGDKLSTLVELGRVEAWQEIRPGIWLPMAWSITVYDDFKSTPEKLFLWNTQRLTVEDVRLDPNYPISLFRDIPIPDDAVVYELRDGKIVNSYVQSERPKPPPEKRTEWWRWVPLALLLCVGVAGLVLWLRKRGRPAQGISSPKPAPNSGAGTG